MGTARKKGDKEKEGKLKIRLKSQKNIFGGSFHYVFFFNLLICWKKIFHEYPCGMLDLLLIKEIVDP